MKLPSLQELKRAGSAALSKGLDPSALERGLQYLRDHGFQSFEVSTLGSKGHQIDFRLSESCKTRIDAASVSQPLYSECDCSMAMHGIFCKHQACSAWVIAVIASQKYELTRVEAPILEQLRSFEEEFKKLKTSGSNGSIPNILHRETGYVTHPPLNAEFEGLVFAFPDSPISGSVDLAGWGLKLPPSRAHESALLPDLAIPFYRESELPHPLWRSPISFRGSTHPLIQNPLEVSRRRSIFYLFTDGTRIPVSEILFHKNSTLVPTELLPIASNLHENRSLRMRFFPKSKDLSIWDQKTDEKLDAILLSIAESAAKLVKRGKLKTYLTFQGIWSRDHSAFELGQIDFQQPKDLKSGFTLGGSLGPDHQIHAGIHLELGTDWIWFETFAFRTETRELFFHPYHHWLENYPPRLDCTRHAQFDRVFNRLQDEFHASFSEIHAVPPFEFLKKDSFTPHIRVFSNGTFSVAVETDFGVLDGFPAPILKQFQILTQGIRAWDAGLSDSLFQIRKQAKRANDLRLFRHIGIAALVLQESIRYFIKKDRTFESFFEALKVRLAVLMNKLEGAPHSPHLTLETFCSKAAVEYLESYVRELQRLYEEKLLPLSIPGKNVLLGGAYALYLKILYSWITLSQTQSQGAILLKTKDGVVQNPSFEEPDTLRDLQFFPNPDSAPPSWIRYLLTKKNSGPENLIRAFLPLQNEGALLSLDDQTIEELRDEDFISEFILDEKPDSEGKIDWFELHPKFFFKGVEIEESQAKRLSETGMITFQGKIYRLNQSSLPSLEKLTHFWDQLASATGQKRGSKKSDRIYRLPKHYTLELLALRSTGVRVKGGPIWDGIVRFYETLNSDRPPLELPKSFKGELKAYQHRGVQWIHDLYKLGLGGILADDMGLGKTVQTLVFLEMLRQSSELGHSLIAVPTSLTYNWFSEAARFTPDLPIHIFQSREIAKAREFLDRNQHGVIICTYGLLAEHESFFSNYRWSVHVYDEAQNLKTITAKRTTVSRKLPARFKLCLTGTPLENHMGEFFSLMDLVVPGSLGVFDQFRKTYMQSYSPDPERVQYLKTKTRPLVLRRTKSAILKELPQKSESTVKIPFSEKQLAIYRDIALSWNSKVRKAISDEGESKSQLIMLTALLRLRQVCSAPSSVPNVTYTETPPKLTLLTDNLKSIIETGESALVFTQFLGTFDLLTQELKKAGIPFFSLHGKVSRKDREIQIQKFQEFPKGSVMLMTLKTGGVGLNLTKASYVFHLEPWWNPAVENQATDRTHRIGQTKPVQVYRYIMSESVEEKIEILKGRKSSQFNALFSDVETAQEIGEGGAFSLSQKDFEYLLGV
ncbi:MAG: DEAD/DEAH box helicase [Bdellovibrionales bacterium]|nr:DEAD/DEAH box helicase [Bdellovibrionales bacterium]